YVRIEERIPSDHPLRPIRALVDEALAGLNKRFEGLYSTMGRPSIPPEMLLRATLLQVDRHRVDRRITLGADKAYDVTAFVEDLRARQVTPHIAVDGRVSKLGTVRKTAIDARTTRHSGYRASQICRKRIEEVFSWIKTQAGLAKVKLRGRAKVEA